MFFAFIEKIGWNLPRDGKSILGTNYLNFHFSDESD